MGRVETLTGVPADEVRKVVSDFESEGAVVTKKREANGSWTVVADFGGGFSEINAPLVFAGPGVLAFFQPDRKRRRRFRPGMKVMD